MAAKLWGFPLDSLNQTLLNNVHPSSWVNPDPEPRYHLVVIGAGAAGLVTAAGAAGVGAKVALVEKSLLGGDCLNFGCVPSKSLIYSASAGQDFTAAMERMRRLRSRISAHDSAVRIRDLGVDVFFGHALFENRQTIQVADKRLHFRKAVIATGSQPLILPVPGLQESGFVTNEDIFHLEEQPARLLVVGGGPIGCELAQVFRRFGSDVTLVDLADRLLPREEAEASAVLHSQFQSEGMVLHLGTTLSNVESTGNSKRVTLRTGKEEQEIEVDEILLATGRVPHVGGMKLEDADIAYDHQRGVHVDDFLRTSNPWVYAAGDCCLSHKFTHTADAAARMVIRNALFKGRERLSALTIPWCTYTRPEIAHVGLSESEAREKHGTIEIIRIPFSTVDRAILDGDERGSLSLVLKKGSDTIVGATIVGAHAGEMISEVTLAMTQKIGLRKIASVIHPYPTQAEAIRKAADAYNRTRLTPAVKKLLRWWLSLTG
jgi:pyruvate/2-oxoglutarate dehydrogenase complex dihydrolipoamide dehydrogenase (E3) component